MKPNELCHVATTTFRNEIGSVMYPFESGRYWLFTSKLCPFAHRTEIVRQLSGMDQHFGLTIAGSVQTRLGWDLGEIYAGEGNTSSPVAGIDRLPDLYKLASSGYTGRASVPVLFDTKTQTIVNNESAEIIRILDSLAVVYLGFKTINPDFNRDEVDAMTGYLNEEFIKPIYLAGFASDQSDYQANYDKVFAALDLLERHFARTGPFLVGQELTLADVHAYPHFARFDAIYHTLYRLNRNFIYEFAHIAEYLDLLGSIPAFSDTLDLQASKEGYFLSWNQPTNAHFVPAGPIVDSRSGVALAATVAEAA